MFGFHLFRLFLWSNVIVINMSDRITITGRQKVILFQQLLLKFHLCTSDSDIEARFAELAGEFYKAAEEKMKVSKENVTKLDQSV